MFRSQLFDPILEAGDKIHFQGQLDDQLRMIAPGLLDLFDISVEVRLEQAPVIPVVARHGIVFGKANFP